MQIFKHANLEAHKIKSDIKWYIQIGAVLHQPGTCDREQKTYGKQNDRHRRWRAQ
jgi:hypothetical protein